VRHGSRTNRRGPTAIGFCNRRGPTTAGRLSMENVKINRKKDIFSGGPTDQPPTADGSRIILRDATRSVGCSVGLEPQPLTSREASLVTTLHNHTCPHSVSFLLTLYLARYKLLFKALNGIKLKSCKLQSFITFRDTQFPCLQFLNLRSFRIFFKKKSNRRGPRRLHGPLPALYVGHNGWP
jgi:hypothetical protein